MKLKIILITFLFIIVSFIIISNYDASKEIISIEFTSEEINFIKKHPVITLAPDPNFAPVEFFDEDGNFSGIVSDYIKYINDNTDLTIQIVKYDSWTEIIEAVQNKEVDLLGGVSKSKKREKFLLFSENYLDIPNVLVSKKTNLDFNRETLSNIEIGVVNNSANHDLLKEKYPKANIIPVKDIKTALERVSIGNLDVFLGSLGQISYYIDYYKYTNLNIVEELEYSYPIHFAIRNDYEELHNIMNKILISMPEDTKTTIYEKWFGANSTNYFISKDFFQKIVSIFLVILISSFGFIRFLKNKINQRSIKINQLGNQLRKELVKSNKMSLEIALSMINLIEIHDDYTKDHSQNVSYYTCLMGKSMNFSEKKLEQAFYAALLHDLGKSVISKDIISKKGKLTKDEYKEIKKHALYSYKILKKIKSFECIANNVLSHHERYDGKGYPNGLKGDEIPLIARIICVADAFDAMTTTRSYRKSITLKEALEELKRNAGTQFDPSVVEIFLKVVNIKDFINYKESSLKTEFIYREVL